jgi:hypothetical protein
MGQLTDSAPEEQAKVFLSAWLQREGAAVFWEENTEWPFPTFSVSGTGGRKPDLVASTQAGKTIALEVKSGYNTSGPITGLIQAFGYWRDYSTRKANYNLPNRMGDNHKIDVFAVATQYAKQGAAFCPDGNRDSIRDDYASDERTWRNTPDQEHNCSLVLRMTAARLIRDLYGYENLPDGAPGFGLLLSDALDDRSGDTVRPWVCYYDESFDNWEPVVE